MAGRRHREQAPAQSCRLRRRCNSLLLRGQVQTRLQASRCSRSVSSRSSSFSLRGCGSAKQVPRSGLFYDSNDKKLSRQATQVAAIVGARAAVGFVLAGSEVHWLEWTSLVANYESVSGGTDHSKVLSLWTSQCTCNFFLSTGMFAKRSAYRYAKRSMCCRRKDDIRPSSPLAFLRRFLRRVFVDTNLPFTCPKMSATAFDREFAHAMPNHTSETSGDGVILDGCLCSARSVGSVIAQSCHQGPSAQRPRQIPQGCGGARHRSEGAIPTHYSCFSQPIVSWHWFWLLPRDSHVRSSHNASIALCGGSRE